MKWLKLSAFAILLFTAGTARATDPTDVSPYTTVYTSSPPTVTPSGSGFSMLTAANQTAFDALVDSWNADTGIIEFDMGSGYSVWARPDTNTASSPNGACPNILYYGSMPWDGLTLTNGVPVAYSVLQGYGITQFQKTGEWWTDDDGNCWYGDCTVTVEFKIAISGYWIPVGGTVYFFPDATFEGGSDDNCWQSMKQTWDFDLTDCYPFGGGFVVPSAPTLPSPSTLPAWTPPMTPPVGAPPASVTAPYIGSIDRTWDPPSVIPPLPTDLGGNSILDYWDNLQWLSPTRFIGTPKFRKKRDEAGGGPGGGGS